uniref:Uncharacterized protein n=1 Tax=Arundo donax TaxID=35708 RepID=A0A0A8YIZ9_ARUDO
MSELSGSKSSGYAGKQSSD